MGPQDQGKPQSPGRGPLQEHEQAGDTLLPAIAHARNVGFVLSAVTGVSELSVEEGLHWICFIWT